MKKFFSLKKALNFIKAHKILSAVIVVILLVVIFRVSSRAIASRDPENLYEFSQVKKQDLVQSVSASGEVEAENQVTLKFQASGKLAWIGVKEGDHVKKWQAIASLDKRELEKDLKKELIDYLNERWDFEQTYEDYDKSGLSEEKWIVTDAIKRILQKAQFDLDRTVIDVEIADLAIKLATVISPIDGIITKIETPIAGVNITPATAEFIVADPSAMKFVANVDEADIAQIRPGQKVSISLDAYQDEEFEGMVHKIAFASITTRGGGTAFQVEVILPDNQNERFKIGMNGDIEIQIEQKQDVLVVPNEAIKYQKGKTIVKVLENGKLIEVEVKTGLEANTKTEVVEGLLEKQEVVIGEKD